MTESTKTASRPYKVAVYDIGEDGDIVVFGMTDADEARPLAKRHMCSQCCTTNERRRELGLRVFERDEDAHDCVYLDDADVVTGWWRTVPDRSGQYGWWLRKADDNARGARPGVLFRGY